MKAYPKEFLKFIELFNEGKYFESHEVLEDLWRRTAGEEKLFYQGLIQAAVCLHHLRQGNREGMEYEFRAAAEKLRKFPDHYLGIDNRQFMRDLERCTAAPDFKNLPDLPGIKLESKK